MQCPYEGSPPHSHTHAKTDGSPVATVIEILDILSCRPDYPQFRIV